MSKIKTEIKTEPTDQEIILNVFNIKSESLVKNEFLETDCKLKFEAKSELIDPELQLWNEELRRIKEMVNLDDEKLITGHLDSIDDLKVIFFDYIPHIFLIFLQKIIK
jgi:hypothetical protein